MAHNTGKKNRKIQFSPSHSCKNAQDHFNNERSQFSDSVSPIESSQILFPTHFVADVRFFTPSDPWIRSMDLIHGSDPGI